MQRLPHQLGPGVCWQEVQRWLLAVEEHLGHCQEKGAGRSRRTPAGGSSALGGVGGLCCEGMVGNLGSSNAPCWVRSARQADQQERSEEENAAL